MESKKRVRFFTMISFGLCSSLVLISAKDGHGNKDLLPLLYNYSTHSSPLYIFIVDDLDDTPSPDY